MIWNRVYFSHLHVKLLVGCNNRLKIMIFFFFTAPLNCNYIMMKQKEKKFCGRDFFSEVSVIHNA